MRCQNTAYASLATAASILVYAFPGHLGLCCIGEINYPVEAVIGKDFDETTISSIDVSNTESAEFALKTVDLALEEVNAMRARLGALNNP